MKIEHLVEKLQTTYDYYARETKKDEQNLMKKMTSPLSKE